MGIYYALVNVTKKQRYEPANGAVKHGNFIWNAEEMLELMLGPWIGDEVRLCHDSYGHLYEQSYDWPAPSHPLYAEDGDGLKLKLDRNGMTKMLTQFVEAFGADAVRVALDAAMEKAEAA